jgi:putative tricarboxylic transport membrane protein
MVVAMILGPMFEAQLRRSLSISQGDPLTLVQSPFAVFVYSTVAVLFAVSLWLRRREKDVGQALQDLEDDEPLGTAQKAGRS